MGPSECSQVMQKRRGKAWEKESRALSQVDVRVDTREVVPDKES